jgi:hypothetical protein
MRHGIAVRLAALTLTLAVVACDDRSQLIAPTGHKPKLRLEDYGGQAFDRPQPLSALGRLLPLERDLSVSRTISPWGGSISVPLAGVSLRFPAGAVSSPVLVTVRAHAGNRVAYTFEPHGLEFSAPVEVAQLLVATAAYGQADILRDLQGAYLPYGVADLDAAGVARVEEVYPVRLRTINSFSSDFVPAIATFRIGHFSGYMLASGRKDTTSQTVRLP